MKYDHNGNPTMTQDGLSMEERISMLANIMVLQSRVIKHQTLILSEHYKKRDIISNGEQLTDDEKLKRQFNIMDRHIEQMQEIQDDLCE
jgi:hypothetical protein